MRFYIGQTFENKYPPEAAVWCNENNSHIEKKGNGYIIVENPERIIEPEEIIQIYEDAVQSHLDSTAQSRGYDNTYTCLSYLSSTDAKWNREAKAFNYWRDSVWLKCHEILNAFKSGEIEQPTVEELIASLPVIDWGDSVEDSEV